MTHVGYWSDTAIHEDIVNRVMQLATTRPDTTVESKWWGKVQPIADVFLHLLLRVLTLATALFFLYKLLAPLRTWAGQIKDALSSLTGLVVSMLVWKLHTTVHRGLLQMWRYTKGTDTAALP